MKSRIDFRAVKRVIDIYRKHDYSALHAHTPRTLLVARIAADCLGCPLMYHVHSPVGRDSNRGLTNRINTWLETWSLRRVTKMICVSRSLKNYMLELGHSPDKVCVVNNGVATINELSQRNLPGATWVIGVMALFRPRKGLEVLLDAVELLKRRGVFVRVRAVGQFETGSYESEIMKRVADLGISEQIEWTGFQTDVNQQLCKMDVFVLPSLYGEGLPMVVLEAMANAVPVVASNVEGIPEAVRDGIDGLIFEPGNHQSLAEKIQELLSNLRRWKLMSRSAFDHQRRSLSDISMAKGVAAVYDQILNGS
jgi:glycosyltransferase involved in cell wall biosynthesis